MKRISVFLFVFMLLISLCSCQKHFETEEKNVEFSAQYVRTGAYAEVDYYPVLAVLSSKSELNAYYSANKKSYDLERRVLKENYINETIGFLDATDKYDDEFFKEKALVLIVFEEVSGSITHKVDNVRINADGYFCVEITSDVPTMCNDALEHWHIIVEVPKESAPEDYEDILIYKDNILLNEDGHMHQTSADENGEIESVDVYCGNTMTTVNFKDGRSYTFMSGNSVTMTDILRYLDYDKNKVCKCLPEYTVDTEFGTGYGINLTSGYVRCDKGQADLTKAQLEKLKEIITWAEEKAE